MEETIKVQAEIRPFHSISYVPAIYTGKIISLHYTNTQSVKAGDLLLQTDTSYEKKQAENATIALEKYIKDIAGLNVLLMAIENNTAVSINSQEILQRYNVYNAEYQRYNDALELSKRMYDRGLSIPIEMTTIQRLDELNSTYRQNFYMLEYWKNSQISQIQEEINSLLQKKQETEASKIHLEQVIRHSSLYAPINGKIDELSQKNIGDTIFEGENILRIIPETEKLKVVMLVHPLNIAKIQLGQNVYIRFPGLAPSKYGVTKATINLIPADNTTIDGSTYFLVEAEIDIPYLISPEKEKIFLKTGMTAEARIVVDIDTVLRFILSKLDFII